MSEENEEHDSEEWVESTEYEYVYWDCRYCGQKTIRGDLKSCSACGHPRDENVTFYEKAEAEQITDKGVIDTLAAGPDWGCTFCQTMNAHQATTCKGCGNKRSDSDKSYFEIQQKKADREAPVIEESKGGKNKLLTYAAIGVVVIGGLIFWATRTTKVMFKVDRVHWQTVAPVERYTEGRFENWRSEISGDQVNQLASAPKIRRYEKRQVGTKTETYTEMKQVQSGSKQECRTQTTSSGSGMQKKERICRNVPVYKSQPVTKTRVVPVYRDEPVHEDWVTYSAKKYTLYSNNARAGNDNSPQWTQVTLGSGLDNKPDKALTKSGVYTVNISKKNAKDKGPGNFEFTTSLEKFQQKYISGKDAEMIIGQMGGVKLEKDEKEVEKKSAN